MVADIWRTDSGLKERFTEPLASGLACKSARPSAPICMLLAKISAFVTHGSGHRLTGGRRAEDMRLPGPLAAPLPLHAYQLSRVSAGLLLSVPGR